MSVPNPPGIPVQNLPVATGPGPGIANPKLKFKFCSEFYSEQGNG